MMLSIAPFGLPRRRARRCGRAECCFTSRGPEREVGHAPQPGVMNAIQGAQILHRHIEDGAEDAQIRPADHFLDAVQEDRATDTYTISTPSAVERAPRA